MFFSKAFCRHLQNMSLRHLQDISSRRLQHNNFSSSKASSRHLGRCLQDVFKASLQDVLGDEKLLRWRSIEDVYKTCLEDVLKTNKCLLGWVQKHIQNAVKQLWRSFLQKILRISVADCFRKIFVLDVWPISVCTS